MDFRFRTWNIRIFPITSANYRRPSPEGYKYFIVIIDVFDNSFPGRWGWIRCENIMPDVVRVKNYIRIHQQDWTPLCAAVTGRFSQLVTLAVIFNSKRSGVSTRQIYRAIGHRSFQRGIRRNPRVTITHNILFSTTHICFSVKRIIIVIQTHIIILGTRVVFGIIPARASA